jgi:hypothetical protein
MARTNSAKASPKNRKPEEGGQETPSPVAKPVKKVDAAKAALNAGIDSPQLAVAYIAQHYGIELLPQHFSAIKSQLKKKQGLAEPAAKRGPKPKGAAAVEGYLAPPPTLQPVTGEPDLLAAMETMKPLIAALGAEKVKRIVDLLG